MGDRGNVFFVDNASGKQLDGIYMYTHWSGGFLPAIVRAALKRGEGRWGDSQYLARIIFCGLVHEAVMEETGFGLSTQIGDNEHAIIRVDDTKERVSFHAAGGERNPKDKALASWSYEEFVAAGDQALLSVFAPINEDEEEEDDDVIPAATAKKKKPATKKAVATKKPVKKPVTKKKAVAKKASSRPTKR
jgi:hypothetical protein